MPKLVDRATYSPGPAGPRRRDERPRPRATGEQVGAWQALARAYQRTLRAQEDALRGTELDLLEYDVLVTLAGAPPQGIRPTELAERVLLTKSGMTRLLDRLEGRGLIERHACPTDRRGQQVALTAQGRHLQRRAAPGLMRALGAAFRSLSAQELAGLARAAYRMAEESTAHSPE